MPLKSFGEFIRKIIKYPGEAVNRIEGPDEQKLPPPLAAALFLTGCFFIIAPIPYFLVCRGTVTNMLITAMLPPVCGFLLMACGLIKHGGISSLHLHLLDRKDWISCIRGTAMIILCYVIVTAAWKVFLSALKIPFAENQYLLSLAINAEPAEFFLLAFLVMFPVPLAEELLFRRILYAGLLPAGKLFALSASSLAFSAAHLFLAGIPGLFVIGIGLQLLYLSRKNLLCAIASHAMLNGCTLLMTALTVWITKS